MIRKLVVFVCLAGGISLNAGAVKFDADVPVGIKNQMVADLNFMSGIQGEGRQTRFHQQVFGQISGNQYQKFFDTHIDGVGLNACGGGNAVACVIPFYGKKMWLTQNFIKFSHPQIARLMVVYHEARHTESNNRNWPHDTCPVPFLDVNGKDMTSIWTGAKLEGQAACDSTAFGSYGSSTILLKNISMFCSNCNDKVKMDADIYAADQINRIDDPRVKQSMLNDFAGR